MSHLQAPAVSINNTSQTSGSSYVGYWPGHVVADCLVDENENETSKDSSFTKSLKKITKKLSRADLNSKHDLNNNCFEVNSQNDMINTAKLLTKIKPGSSFSAIISSMVPFEILTRILKNENAKLKEIVDTLYEEEYTYDEFGFKLDRPDSAMESTNDSEVFIDVSLDHIASINQLNDKIFAEDSKHKLKWIAYLEFTLNADIGQSFSWDEVTQLNRCEKLKQMTRGQGIPHSLRQFMWMRLSGAFEKKSRSQFKYSELCKSHNHDHYQTSKQIEKDLLRTLPSNACFANMSSVGIPRLRRVLQAIAWLFPNIGYCQGMGPIVATLLLFFEEEDAFWLMNAIIEDILPASYYSHTLIGVQADIKVLSQLIGMYLPEIENKFKEYEIELSLICINWFLTIFSNVFHIKILLRIWDLFFYEGSVAIFQITLAMLKMNESEILKAESSSEIFTVLSEIPSTIYDIDLLIEMSIRVASSVNKSQVDSIRRKHQAYLMAQNGAIINPSKYESLLLSRERSRNLDIRSQNFMSLFKKMTKSTSSNEVNPNNDSLCEEKMKNILQTEFLVNLREIILKIAHHFQTKDPKAYLNVCDLNADYSIESHSKDIENYMKITTEPSLKRAKALVTFEITDDDELGFQKNDIITILSTKDDHCWIGELNNKKGWFPSRLVSLIDERNGKIYSAAGDDSIMPEIRDLIRGEFSQNIRLIFEHGLKKWTVLGGTMHPWSFINEAAKKNIEKEFDSVYSRLVLCKTFRLDEDGKVLTPDELLFRSIQLVNLSHEGISLDVKFRSLICIGLNEQVLHLWLETLCSNIDLVEKWYHPWSFIRSPGWVQIKCELRILSQFSFLLNPDFELPDAKKDRAINDCIKDMLVKHHLFSWDIN